MEKPYGLIKFYYDDVSFPFRRRKKVKSFIGKIFKKERKSFIRVDFVFCSDPTLRRLNVKFLQHNYNTDIITFPLSFKPPIQAEIYISIDRIKENSKSFNTSISKELLRVMFHGVLHLCGYKDKSPRDQQLMREKEDYYLSLYESFT